MQHQQRHSPHTLTAKTQLTIDAKPAEVWKALTDPKLIKQYFMGTQVKTDWQVGSPITWTGEWEGKKYEDKGEILEFSPHERLAMTYWSSMAGKADKPENYKNVTYTLTPVDGRTKLAISQDNCATEKEQEHSQKNWKMVLEGLRKLVEHETT